MTTARNKQKYFILFEHKSTWKRRVRILADVSLSELSGTFFRREKKLFFILQNIRRTFSSFSSSSSSSDFQNVKIGPNSTLCYFKLKFIVKLTFSAWHKNFLFCQYSSRQPFTFAFSCTSSVDLSQPI